MSGPAGLRGVRFAPSPTGAFHVGNFRTAWISWKWARLLGEPWVLRFEDIDEPRVVPGAREGQAREMAALGLSADETLVQSALGARHAEAFEHARRVGQVYPCFCSRKDVREALEGAASAPHGEVPVYSGHCRDLRAAPEHRLPSVAWRFKAADPSGRQDFIVGRTGPELSGFVPAYNWACAIDDWDGAYRLLVRAWDLAPVALQQRAVQEWLRRAGGPAERAIPWIFHTALVTGNRGERLEKRTRGVTLAELEARGIGPGELVRRFEESFVPDASMLGAGPEIGEPKRTLSLAELGIPVSGEAG